MFKILSPNKLEKIQESALRFINNDHISALRTLLMRGYREGGDAVGTHPRKSQVLYISIELSNWTPSLEKVGTPSKMLDPRWNLGKI